MMQKGVLMGGTKNTLTLLLAKEYDRKYEEALSKWEIK
jgi:hypothetical protein